MKSESLVTNLIMNRSYYVLCPRIKEVLTMWEKKFIQFPPNSKLNNFCLINKLGFLNSGTRNQNYHKFQRLKIWKKKHENIE